jgi:hypothetical protein
MFSGRLCIGVYRWRSGGKPSRAAAGKADGRFWEQISWWIEIRIYTRPPPGHNGLARMDLASFVTSSLLNRQSHRPQPIFNIETLEK